MPYIYTQVLPLPYNHTFIFNMYMYFDHMNSVHVFMMLLVGMHISLYMFSLSMHAVQFDKLQNQ